MTSSNDNSQKTNEIDKRLGCGFYQLLHFLLFQWITILLACNMGFMIFAKVVPQISWDIDCVSRDFNITANESVESVKRCTRSEICSLIDTQNISFERLNWTTDFYSIVPQFHLICQQRIMVTYSLMAHMGGVLIGSPIGGQMSDWFGRKWALLVTTVSLVIVGACSALASSIHMFIGFRFFIGFFCGSVIVVNFVYFNEFLIPKHRLWINSIGGWPLGFGCLALFAWITRDWRYLSLLINLNVIPCIILLIFMKESAYWLIQKNDFVEAKSSLLFVAKLNREKSENYDKQLERLFSTEVLETDSAAPKSKRKVYSVWHLFTNMKLCLNTIILCFAFLTTSAVAYGILFDLDRHMGNRYLNLFLISALRMVTAAITIACDFFIKKCGRKVLFILPTALLGACCIVIVIMISRGNQSYDVTLMAIAGSTLTSPIWIAISLSNAEIYPTAIRNVAYGFTQTFSRLGGAITPWFILLANYWSPAPYFIFAVLSLISSILYGVIISETKGQPLPTEMPVKHRKKEVFELENIDCL